MFDGFTSSTLTSNPSEAEQTSQPANTSASNRKGKGRAKAKQTQEAGPSTTRLRKAEPGILPEDYHERARYWDFYSFRNPPKGAVAKKIRPQIDYINDLMKGWRPTNQKMGMPEEWFVSRQTTCIIKRRDNESNKCHLAVVYDYFILFRLKKPLLSCRTIDLGTTRITTERRLIGNG